MKILLLGDLSGVHKNLQIGLHECGYSDTLLSTTGDGFKNIKGDIRLPTLDNFSIRAKIAYRIKFLSYIKTIRGFDIVQIASPFTFPFPFFPYKNVLKFLKENNGRVFLSAAGNDSIYWQNLRNKLNYSPFDDEINIDLGGIEPKQTYRNSILFNNYLANNVEGIIPVVYEYKKAYKDFKNLRKLIPQPIATSKFKKHIYQLNQKPIKVVHTITRPGSKGTKYIKKAFLNLNRRFSGRAEFILQDKLSFDLYLEAMRNVSIVVDQCNSYSYGMNALFAMSLGKVVFSGAEPEALKALKINNSPVKNIIPDPEFIYESISKLIEKPRTIKELAQSSREYVEKYHDAPKIAQIYIEEWKN